MIAKLAIINNRTIPAFAELTHIRHLDLFSV